MKNAAQNLLATVPPYALFLAGFCAVVGYGVARLLALLGSVTGAA